MVNPTPLLHLRALGGFSLERGGETIASNSEARARHALLSVLAVAGERGVSRERLMGLFWPESDADRARATLKQSLYLLRRELDAPELTHGKGVLCLNAEVIETDLARFASAVQGHDLAAAVGVYRGPLLDGFFAAELPEFDRWLEEERARLAAQHRAVLQQLALAAEAQGDAEAAVDWWRRLVDADRLSAAAAVGFMKALVRAGDRPAALQYARAYQALVQTELESPPDPSVDALAEKIKSSREAHDAAFSSAPNGNGGILRTNGARESGDQIKLHGDPPAVTAPGAVTTSSGSVSAETLALRARRALPRRAIVWTVGVAILIAGIALGWYARRNAPGDTLMRFTLNFEDGLRLAGVPQPLAISPDGSLLAFVAARDTGSARIYVRSVADVQSREYPGTDGASQLFFSHDGRWLGFYAGGVLKKVAAAGGTPEVIAVVPNMFGATWTPRGAIIVSSNDALAEIPVAGGALRRISAPDTSLGEAGERWPLAIGDEAIVFASRRQILEQSRLAILRVSDTRKEISDVLGTAPLAIVGDKLLYASVNNPGTDRNGLVAATFDLRRSRIVSAPVNVVDNVLVGVQGSVAASVSSSGSLLYFTDPALKREVIVRDASGVERVLISEPGAYAFPRFSPDGRRVALTLVGPPWDNQVRVFDRASGTLTPLTGSQAGYPEWTPDGKRILYLRPPGNGGLWWRAADQSDPEELLVRRDSLVATEGVFSRDGRVLVVRMNRVTGPERGFEFWYRSMTGDTALKPLLQGPGLHVGPRVSPDGRWIAYSSGEVGGARVFVTTMASGGPRYQVSADDGWAPVWSPDSHRLYYARKGQLIAATLQFAPSFAVTARELVLKEDFVSEGFHAQYDVSADGHEFLLLRNVGDSPRLTFVHDWQQELRARTRSVTAR